MVKRCAAILFLCFSLAPGLTFAEDGEPNEEAHYLSNIRQLTFEGKRAGEGYFDADGSRIVFQSERLEDNPF